MAKPMPRKVDIRDFAVTSTQFCWVWLSGRKLARLHGRQKGVSHETSSPRMAGS